MYLQSFCKELAKSNHKPRNPELCRRLQDPLSRDTIPKFLSTSSINDGGGKNEIEQMLKKKAIAPVQNEPQQSASYIFIVPKKSKFEEHKLLCRVQPFQNEKFTSFERAPRGGGLLLQTGSKRRLF